MEITVVWDVTPCSLVERYERFEGKYVLRDEERASIKKSYNFCVNFVTDRGS
jgi:hypothetical protein